MKKIVTAITLAGGLVFAGVAHASEIWYEFSFTAADIMGYSFANGADGTTVADNSLFNGARLSREGGGAIDKRTYNSSQQAAFTNWATGTSDRLTTLNFWGFDGRGAKWGEDFKHMDRQMKASPVGWNDWDSVGWVPVWGPNPNPNTFVTAGWFSDTAADGFGFGDAGLASKAFTFRMLFDDTDWLYGSPDTNGAPNTLGGPMTFWFGGWMGDDTAASCGNCYKYIYEGNMVLTGTQVVPEPTTLAILSLGLVGIGFGRRKRLV